jgi:hypothetical protein
MNEMDTRNDLAAALASIARLAAPTGPGVGGVLPLDASSPNAVAQLLPALPAVPASSFIGREREVTEVSELL